MLRSVPAARQAACEIGKTQMLPNDRNSRWWWPRVGIVLVALSGAVCALGWGLGLCVFEARTALVARLQ